MKRDSDWQRFEDFIAEELKDIAPHAKPTKASRYGDLKDVPTLHVECKCYKNINVYKQEWMDKCIEEVPFHSTKTPLLITKNLKNDIVVHLSWLDFKEIYFEYYKLKYGENNA